MDVRLPAGTYFVAVPDGARPRLWIEVNVEDGRLTFADVTGLRATCCVPAGHQFQVATIETTRKVTNANEHGDEDDEHHHR